MTSNSVASPPNTQADRLGKNTRLDPVLWPKEALVWHFDAWQSGVLSQPGRSVTRRWYVP